MAIVAVLDANVLYPAPVRDLLLNLATLHQYQPKWTELILDEFVRNLLNNRTDLKAESFSITRQLMNAWYPDAMIVNFEARIGDLKLPDADDRHVLAAGIEAQVNYIVTENIRDFPDSELKSYDIVAIKADEFITELTTDKNDVLWKALTNQQRNLKNPPQTAEQLIATFKKVQLTTTAARIEKLIGSNKAGRWLIRKVRHARKDRDS